MALLALIIVLALVFHLQWGSEFRQLSWGHQWRSLIVRQFDCTENWQANLRDVTVILVPALLVGWLVQSDGGFLKWLFSLALSAAVLFWCLGPNLIEKDLARYFEDMRGGDSEGALLAFQKLQPKASCSEGDELVRLATRYILTESESRYFGVIFWFILVGPAAALAYRLTEQFARQSEDNEFLKQVWHWADWLPARLTSLLFLLTGDFVAGFYRLKDYIYDADASSRQMLADTGVAALGLDMGVAETSTVENRQALGLVQRTLILYLVLAAILTPFALW